MNSEIKYPYIGKSTHSDNVVLFKADGFGVSINSGSCTYIADWNESAFKNITHECISNTWGVVESKEHAEFIIKLAELHGFKINEGPELSEATSTFIIGRSKVSFCDGNGSSFNLVGVDKITIPLPPKTEVSAGDLTPEEEFELHQNQAVQALNNTATDAETWPNLGDPVTVYGQQGIVILPADRNGFYIINADGLYLAAKAADITKPKSKEDLLIEELQTRLCENNYVDNYTLANDIVNGMIEGLIYEPK